MQCLPGLKYRLEWTAVPETDRGPPPASQAAIGLISPEESTANATPGSPRGLSLQEYPGNHDETQHGFIHDFSVSSADDRSCHRIAQTAAWYLRLDHVAR